MFKPGIAYIFILLAACLCACAEKNDVNAVLNRAEQIMKQEPDTALQLIRSLENVPFKKESQQARYALLYSQALENNMIYISSDTIIRTALDYYRKKGNDLEKAKSCYYMGKVCQNAGRHSEAMDWFAQADRVLTLLGKTQKKEQLFESPQKSSGYIDSLGKDAKESLALGIEVNYKLKYWQDAYLLMRQKYTYQILLTGGICILFILFAFMFIHRRKEEREKKKIEIEQYRLLADAALEQSEALRCKYERLFSDYNRQDKKIACFRESFEERLAGVKQLLNISYVYSGNQKLFREKMGDYLAREAGKMGKLFTDLTAAANLCYYGIIDYLQETYRLKEDELFICGMICLGFSPQETGIISNYTEGSIYNKRSKLKLKFGLSGRDVSLELFFSRTISFLKTREKAA